jgi:Transposase DDE domain group 1
MAKVSPAARSLFVPAPCLRVVLRDPFPVLIEKAEIDHGYAVARSRTLYQTSGAPRHSPAGRTCYHPLFLFNQFGDLERCSLRPGNVHSADGWEGVLKPIVTRYQSKVSRLYFRADAGFVYEYLEAEGIKYAIRLPANRVLQGRIGVGAWVRSCRGFGIAKILKMRQLHPRQGYHPVDVGSKSSVAGETGSWRR